MKVFAPKQKVHRSASEGTAQRRLEVGAPNDKYEHEANTVAENVVSSPSATQSKANAITKDEEETKIQMQPDEEDKGKLQMQSEEEETKIRMQPEEEEGSKIMMQPEEEDMGKVQLQPEEEESKIQMQEEEEMGKLQMQSEEEEGSKTKGFSKDEESKASGGVAPAGNPGRVASPTVSNQVMSSRGAGRPLPKNVKYEYGRKMDTNFDQVRIHADGKAAQMNKELGAKAFTYGNDIYFNSGNYNTENTSGKRLLAHELTHVVQQTPEIRKNNGSTPAKKGKLKSGPTYKPNGTLTATLSGGKKYSPSFTLNAEFDHDPANGVYASCCEARQYIMWSSNADKPNHAGFSGSYKANTWYEDRDSADKRYGHRTGTHSECINANHYMDSSGAKDCVNGVKYYGYDRPVDGSGAKTGKWYFKLKVIDTHNGNTQLGSPDNVTVDW